MKRKLLLAALCVVGALGGGSSLMAQTDVTSTYLTNADFSSSTAITTNLKGYGKDGTPYGFQTVDGWTSVVLSGDNSNATYPNSGMGAAVFEYGSSYQLQGGNKAAPSTNPNEGTTGNALGFFAVWGNGGYYYQDVTLAAGKYTLTIPIYNQQGTQANTTYTGFFPTSGTNRTVAINTTVGSWVNQTVIFTLTEDTPGQIRIGYQSTGEGSGANPHLFIDGVKIEYTAVVVKDVLSTALAAATKANAVLSDGDLATAISTAQDVYDDEDATQDQVNAAAATLSTATELAMSETGDVTGIFLSNPGFESCTVTSTNAAAVGSAAPLDIAGEWTQSSSAAWSSSAVVAYGGSGQVNGASAPSADNAGNGGNTLGISVGWGGLVAYQTAAVTLPAGVYTLKVNAYNNLSGVTQFTSKFGFVPTDGTSTISTKTSFSYGTWETDQVTFTLNEATEGKIQVGGEAISGGSDKNAKVFFDNITLNYKSFLAGAKEAWDNAVAAAEEAKAANPSVTGEELTALNEELAKSEPTTVDGYNDATDALNGATATLTAAKTSYDALQAKKTEAAAYTTVAWPYASAAKKTALDGAVAATATSASDAVTKTAAITTAIRQFVESNGLAEGDATAIDFTSYITNAAGTSVTGWTVTNTSNTTDPTAKGDQKYTTGNGEASSNYIDGGWNGSTACNQTLTQEITLPAGEYLLQITARSNVATYTMSIGGESVDLPKDADSGGLFDKGWSDAYVEFNSTGEALTLTIHAEATASKTWYSFNRLRLHKVNNTLADDDDYDALNDAIDEAEAKTLGFKVGEYAPYTNVAALEALAAAKAIDQEANNEQATVQDATTALSGATWTANTVEKAIIYNSNFAEADGNNPKGWTRSNGAWGQQQTGLGADTDNGTAWYYNTNGAWEYGKKVGYNMPLEANTVYLLEFKYRSHETNSNNNLTASVLNDSNEGLSATAVGANKTTTFVKKSLTFKTGAAGDYVLSLLQDGNTWVTDVYLTKVPAIVKTSSANLQGYKTFYNADVNYEVDANTTIYKAAAPNTGYVTLTEVNADRIIPAGTPVILKTSNTTDYQMTLTPTATASANVFDGNVLQVADETGTIDGAYILAYKNPDFGFFQYTGSLDAGDIYLTAPASAKSRLIITIDGEATGIEAVETVEADDNAPAYNVAGQPVTKDYKGIVIKNGKKFLQK